MKTLRIGFALVGLLVACVRPQATGVDAGQALCVTVVHTRYAGVRTVCGADAATVEGVLAAHDTGGVR